MNSTLYDDAELAAIQIVREAVAEDTAEPDHSYSQAVNDQLLAIQEQHGPGGVTGVVAALGRLVTVALSSPAKPWKELAAVLDEFEMHKIEQHQLEQDEQ